MDRFAKLKNLGQALKEVITSGEIGAGLVDVAETMKNQGEAVGEFLGDALQADLNNSLTQRPAVKYQTVATGNCVRCGANQSAHAEGGACGAWEAETRTEVGR